MIKPPKRNTIILKTIQFRQNTKTFQPRGSLCQSIESNILTAIKIETGRK